MSPQLPDATRLREAALAHLARYAATEAGLARVLGRRIDRWARQAEEPPEVVADAAAAAKAAIPGIILDLRAAGLLSDAAFAASRAKRLTREGKSRRHALAHLAAKGVEASAAAATLPDDPARELAAACAFLRRRRAGPFGDAPELKTLGAMARAGFAQSTARAAMRLGKEHAEALVRGLQK